jgi:peptidyl-prolyl cis-trans isomerase C
VVAKVRGKAITVGEVKEYLLWSPARRTGAISKRAARERLGGMLTSEALYQEALHLGMDKDPEVVHKIRQIIIQKLLEEKVTRPVEGWKISEQELEAYYEAHKSQFYRPEQVRLADIFISVPKDAPPEQKEEKRRLAGEILKKAISGKNKRFGFSQLIRQYWDKPKGYRRGDTGFFDREGKPAGIDSALVKAAFALNRTGEIADKVIETADGFHVIMLVGKRSETKRDLKQLAPMLKRRMKREELKRRKKAFIEEVKKKSNIEINEDVFAQLIKQMNKTQTQGQGRSNGRSPKSNPPPLPK